MIRFIKQAFQEAGIYPIAPPGVADQAKEEIQYSETEKSKSEVATDEDKQTEKIKELSRDSRPSEKDENYLGKKKEETL